MKKLIWGKITLPIMNIAFSPLRLRNGKLLFWHWQAWCKLILGERTNKISQNNSRATNKERKNASSVTYVGKLCCGGTLIVCKLPGPRTIGVATDDLGTDIFATAAAPVVIKNTTQMK